MPVNSHYWIIFAALLIGVLPINTFAHDADSYGGLYRSRDAGATWLPADAGLYINASNAVAISAADSNHLLYGTDTQLLRSNNGGRDWHEQALVTGPVFCAAFDRDGHGAFAANPNGLFRSDDGVNWRMIEVSSMAIPIAQIVVGRTHVYLAGNDGLYIGNASGQDWRGPANGLPEEAISALLLTEGNTQASIHAVLAGRIWRSTDGGATWQQAAGDWRDQRVDTITTDPDDQRRLWAAGASRLFRSDDAGETWLPHGKPLPDPNIFIRGIAVAVTGSVIVLTTHRGVMRSADSGASWEKIESALPLHLEASPLAQDATNPSIVYAGFSLHPYSEAWRAAQEAAQQLRQARSRNRNSVFALAIGGVLLIGALGFFLRKKAAEQRAASIKS